jgi:hypothetical protein
MIYLGAILYNPGHTLHFLFLRDGLAVWLQCFCLTQSCWLLRLPSKCAPAPKCPHWCNTTTCRIVRFYMLPRAERKATYAGWWSIIKKEAKHYWVGRGEGQG